MTHTTLVVGTGYLGQRFVEACDGHSVVALTRSTYDLDTGGPLPIVLPKSYSVLYTVPPSAESDADVRLQRLLDELNPLPQRFVYISTTGVYGNRDGGVVDEAAVINPASERAARRVTAEEALQSWDDRSACAIMILRVPGIYGPGRLGDERVRQGVPVIDEHAAGPGNRIHVSDLVACCSAALDSNAPAGTYNVGDGDHRTSTWFANEVARQYGLPAPPSISMSEAEHEFSPLRLSFLKESRLVDVQKMHDVLGVKLRYPNPEEGIAASIFLEAAGG